MSVMVREGEVQFFSILIFQQPYLNYLGLSIVDKIVDDKCYRI
jgi:hypothetical protein